jgi:lambda family phage portal protein
MMWPWSKPQPTVRVVPMRVRGRYDAAQTTAENRRHWANADALDARSANSLSVRKALRERSRYEIANNTYAKGMVLTLANDIVGTGPRLQLLSGNEELNARLEDEWANWTIVRDLADKLRTMVMARVGDGEGFGKLIDNPRQGLLASLDVRLIEADQVTEDSLASGWPDHTDGIRYDANGNPISYTILDEHPGSSLGSISKGRSVPARDVVHLFRADRPGQLRGIPEITPALPLFAQLRRYTLAVIQAAEAAADFAVIMKTNMPPGEAAEMDGQWLEMEMQRGQMVFAPEGWDPAQMKAEQPTTSYADFKHEILNEIARCLNMPFNIAAGNSSGYNYSSGRLDHQTYYRSIRIGQNQLERVVMDRLFSAWLLEVSLHLDLPATPLRHHWFWDGQEHVDPAKDANAQATRLKSHTTTLATEYAKQGKDWEEELKQRGKEKALMDQLGLTDADAQPWQDRDEEDEVDE